MIRPIGKKGKLYIVATPIGNLGDITQRALQVLANVDLVLAEDTRHSRHLLTHFAISANLLSCHEHNEAQRIEKVIAELEQGNSIALISDAGTPLISDPGFVLVRAVRVAGFEVLPVPGASSIIAALSVSGLATDRFTYDGFLPAKSSARKTQLKQYRNEPRTVVLLESSHRIRNSLQDMQLILGSDRQCVLARELTKKFETVLHGSVAHLVDALNEDENQTRGEFVVLLAGITKVENDNIEELNSLLQILLAELPVKQAVALAGQISGQRKNEIYQIALSIKQSQDEAAAQ